MKTCILRQNKIQSKAAISQRTADALLETMHLAAQQFAGYDGPIQVEIIGRPDEGSPPPPDPDTNNYPRPQEDFFYAQYSF